MNCFSCDTATDDGYWFDRRSSAPVAKPRSKSAIERRRVVWLCCSCYERLMYIEYQHEVCFPNDTIEDSDEC